jgi:hypothetical protein
VAKQPALLAPVFCASRSPNINSQVERPAPARVAAVNRRRAAGRLLAVEGKRRRYRYPAWQVVEGVPLAGLEEILGILTERPHAPITKISFFLSGNVRLGGERPLDRLRRGGEMESVRRAARLLGEQGGA